MSRSSVDRGAVNPITTCGLGLPFDQMPQVCATRAASVVGSFPEAKTPCCTIAQAATTRPPAPVIIRI
ncbi:hypothetical protein ACIOBK_02130 [Micromonospora chokoriensis]